MFKRHLPFLTLAGVLIGLASVPIAQAEPSNPDLPRLTNAPVYSFKDTNADGVYDTRVDQLLLPYQPDAYTGPDGMWHLTGNSIEAADLYFVIKVPAEFNNTFLIAGDLRSGLWPETSETLNGRSTKLWFDTNLDGYFGPPGPNTIAVDYNHDSDITTCDWRAEPYCGDFRLWTRNYYGNQKAIVIHEDNTALGIEAYHGWLWNQLPPDKFIPAP